MIGTRHTLSLSDPVVDERDRILAAGSVGSSELYSTRAQAP